MSEKKLAVTARVTVTMELHLPDRWDPGATASEVHEQAARSAKFLLDRLLEASARGELKVDGVTQRLRGGVVSLHPVMVACEEVP